MRDIKKITGIYIGCVLIFLLLFSALEDIGVTYCYAADPEQEQQKIKESILSEFEYSKIDDSLQSLFPEKRIIFKEVISEILTGKSEGICKASFRIRQGADVLSASDGQKEFDTYIADCNDCSIHESVCRYPSEPTGGKCRILYDLHVIGGTDGRCF